jgi:hypothetical protein
MSLIKLAGLQSLIMPTVGTTAAMSGSPFSWLMKKSPKQKIFGFIPKPSLRRNVQEINISTIANAINNIRDGKVQDSTRFLSGLADSTIGHAGKLGIGIAEKLNKTPGVSKLYKYLTNRVISRDGKIQIDQLEKLLKTGKKINDISSKISNNPLTLYGAGIGSIVGGSKTPTDDNSRLKNTLKGFMVGGSVGFGAKKIANSVKNKTNPLASIHKHYFADDYWKERIQGANKSVIGPVLANAFTSSPESRANRIKRFNAWRDFNQDVFNKNKFVNLFNTTKDSFKTKNKNKRTLIGSLGNKLFGEDEK